MDLTSWTRPEERPLVRRFLDLANRASRLYCPVRTDFLTPREQKIASSVIRNAELSVAFWGGYAGSERTRAVICPPYVEATPDDFQIAGLSATAASGAVLHHGQLLGSLLGTGIDRKKLGDIAVTSPSSANVAVASDLMDYLQLNWRKAGRHDIVLSELSPDASWPEVVYHTETLSVSSLRLDAVIAAACKWSRSKAQAHIEAGQVSVNFAVEERSNAVVAEADTLSVRGFGRIRMEQVLGETKRGRLRLEVGVIRS